MTENVKPVEKKPMQIQASFLKMNCIVKIVALKVMENKKVDNYLSVVVRKRKNRKESITK